MGRAREEADFGVVAAVDFGEPDVGEDGEVLLVFLEVGEVGREFVVAAGGFGEEVFGEQAEVIADAEEARRRGVSFAKAGRMASSKGRPRATLEERRRKRRVMGMRGLTCDGRSRFG